MMYDPYSGAQMRAHRTDPTGRHSPLTNDNIEPWWVGYAVGIAGGCVFGLILFLGV